MWLNQNFLLPEGVDSPDITFVSLRGGGLLSISMAGNGQVQTETSLVQFNRGVCEKLSCLRGNETLSNVFGTLRHVVSFRFDKISSIFYLRHLHIHTLRCSKVSVGGSRKVPQARH